MLATFGTTAVYFIMAIIHLIFAIIIIQLFGKNRSLYTALAALVIIGLFYDNFIIAIGSFIGEGNLLRNLNAFRFYFHALLTPTLILYVWSVAQRFEIGWAQKPVALIALSVLMLAMIYLGASVDIFDLALVPEIEAGTLRYVNDHSAGPPVPAIVTILVMIVVGAFVWRQHSWSILCVGSILMFIFAGAGASNLILSNIGEVILAGAIVATDRKLAAQKMPLPRDERMRQPVS